MKRIIYILLTIIISTCTASATNLTEAADSAYMSDNFKEAIDLYEQAIRDNGSSSLIYYNLGNAYYRNGNFGKAILNYERALKLDPSNEDAKTNLNFVNGKITDKPVDYSSLTDKIHAKTVTFMSADLWAWTTLALFIAFMLSVAGYIFCSSIILRKICFFGGLVLFVFTLTGIIISFNAAARTTATDKAIVISEAVQLGTSPRTPKNKAEQAFLLHEGTKLTIVDSLNVTTDSLPSKWYEVNVDSEHRAWINSKDIEKI